MQNRPTCSIQLALSDYHLLVRVVAPSPTCIISGSQRAISANDDSLIKPSRYVLISVNDESLTLRVNLVICASTQSIRAT